MSHPWWLRPCVCPSEFWLKRQSGCPASRRWRFSGFPALRSGYIVMETWSDSSPARSGAVERAKRKIAVCLILSFTLLPGFLLAA